MKYLLYAVVRTGDGAFPADTPAGVGGKAVRAIAAGGLSALASLISRTDWTPDLEKVLAYGRVVAYFHRRAAVIPLRYGCLMENGEAVRAFLREQATACDALLSELAGCVEMGIRFLPPSAPAPDAQPENGDAAAGDTGPAPSGMDYLRRRRRHYARADAEIRIGRETAERCRQAFAGLYRRCKSESLATLAPAAPSPLHGLYFLVPEAATAAFGEVFKGFQRESPLPMLLSGPWPPYNFAVLPAATAPVPAAAESVRADPTPGCEDKA